MPMSGSGSAQTAAGGTMLAGATLASVGSASAAGHAIASSAPGDASGLVGNQEIALAASTVLQHLISRLNNFPSVAGAARMTSQVCEADDIDIGVDDLKPEIFKHDSVQVRVCMPSRRGMRRACLI